MPDSRNANGGLCHADPPTPALRPCVRLRDHDGSCAWWDSTPGAVWFYEYGLDGSTEGLVPTLHADLRGRVELTEAEAAALVAWADAARRRKVTR